MNLQQFRFLREAARHKFSLTEAARALHTSQHGISKAIIDLEAELGQRRLALRERHRLFHVPEGRPLIG